MLEQEINTAVEQFRRLMEEQLARQNRMEQAAPAKNFSKQEKIVIGICAGDGIGPILMCEARRLMEKLLAEVPVYHLGCTISEEAVGCLENVLRQEEPNGRRE